MRRGPQLSSPWRMARLAVHVCIRTCTRPFYAARAAASRYIVRFFINTGAVPGYPVFADTLHTCSIHNT